VAQCNLNRLALPPEVEEVVLAADAIRSASKLPKGRRWSTWSRVSGRSWSCDQPVRTSTTSCGVVRPW
jgi:hypothetical protein